MADQRNCSGTPAQPDLPSNVPGAGAGRKVAIPRLKEGSVKSISTKEPIFFKDPKNRVPHACEPCRQRKTKCSGERPQCRHCEDFHIQCHYGDGKRDRAKNEMLILQQKVECYENLLKQLSQQVGGPTQDKIYKALGKVANSLPPSTSSEHIINSNGTNDPLARDQDDIFTRASDGKAKEMETPLIKNLSKDRTENSLETVSPTPGKKAGATATPIIQIENSVTAEMVLENPTSHLDDLDLSLVGDQVDPFDLPSKVTADILIKNYFETVQPMFPILLKELFMVQYESFYKFQFTPESSKRWLGILNVIFAIGAVYSNMVNSGNPRNQQNHLRYFTRARILALDGGAVYEAADLQQIQVAGLMGVYLVSTSQNNRALKITGLAIRYAQTLGLHLRTDSTRITDSEKEMRVRIWYAISCLDKHLAFMTGRPPVIQDNDCTVSMPKPIENEVFLPENITMEAHIPPDNSAESSLATADGIHSTYPSTSSNPASYLTPSTPGTSIPPEIVYFTEYARISKITVEALGSLHCPETMLLSWLEVQQKISDLDASLNMWKAGLPPILDFLKPHRDQTLTRQRMSLAFQYYHTRIIMNRPCLCRKDVRGTTEASRVISFNRQAAFACVKSARETLKLLPPVQNSSSFYRIAPWWCLFHYLVSAGNIIIVEVAMKLEHTSSQLGNLLNDAKRLVYWLKAIGQQNLAARRAYEILSKLLSVAVPKLKYFEDDTTNSDSASPMVGVEATQAEYIPAITASHSANQVYDELPAPWERNFGITSMMFPTPQQMHEIDVEDDLRRRDSIIAHQQEIKRSHQAPVFTEEYFPQWDPLDTVLGKRPYGNMPYLPPAGAAEGEYHPLAPPEIQQAEAQLDGVTSSVDGIGGSADTPDGTESSSSSPPQSISSPPTSRGQVAYHNQIREELLRRHSQAGSGQIQQVQQHYERSKKRRESPS